MQKQLKKFRKIGCNLGQQLKVFDGLAYKHVHLKVMMNLQL